MDTKAPFVFNSLKHHLESVIHFLRESINHYNENEFTHTLLTIGESQMDFYYGKLSTSEIFKEINCILSKNNISNYYSYSNYLEDNNHFVPVTLSDGSCWILREGTDQNKYIHIHSGRYSLHTLRVKAATLKTAIATVVLCYVNNLPIDLSLINKAREIILKLPPIKNMSNAKGIERVICLLKEDTQCHWFNSK